MAEIGIGSKSIDRKSQEKNNYRGNSLFLRNEYPMEGKWGLPIIRKQTIDLERVELIASSDTSKRDTKNLRKGIHHFVDDPRFEGVYRRPDRTLEKYGKYRFVITPDYSLFSEMPLWRQIESVGKTRWCGAYWQARGLSVVPSVSWGLYPTFDFCFSSIERGCAVAVSMIGCKHSRLGFMRGYDTMLEAVEPEAIICLGDPFPEMEGNLIIVDYRESRKTER